MIFIPAKLRDVWRIEIERRTDARGFLARTMCEREFAAKGLSHSFVQTNTAFTFFAGTVRGLHFQRPPHSISKLIRCTRGATFEIVVDLRADSPTFLRWEAFELTADRGGMLFVPMNFAHGYQTLQDATEVTSHLSGFPAPEAERGLRWDDPVLGVQWPRPVTTISAGDAAWPLLNSSFGIGSAPLRGRRSS